MRDGRVVQSYAEALYELAQSQGVQAQVLSDLARFRVAMDGIERGWSTLLHPLLPPAEKDRVLKVALEGCQPLIGQTVRLLLKHRRERALSEFFRGYLEVHEAREGIVRVVVETATPLDPAAAVDIAERMAKELGREVRLESQVEPALVRGMRLRVGSQLIDGSLRGQLDRLRSRLLAVRVEA